MYTYVYICIYIYIYVYIQFFYTLTFHVLLTRTLSQGLMAGVGAAHGTRCMAGADTASQHIVGVKVKVAILTLVTCTACHVGLTLALSTNLHGTEFELLCCLTTPVLSKDIQCHGWKKMDITDNRELNSYTSRRARSLLTCSASPLQQQCTPYAQGHFVHHSNLKT